MNFYDNGEDLSLNVIATIGCSFKQKKSVFEHLSNDFFSETKMY